MVQHNSTNTYNYIFMCQKLALKRDYCTFFVYYAYVYTTELHNNSLPEFCQQQFSHSENILALCLDTIITEVGVSQRLTWKCPTYELGPAQPTIVGDPPKTTKHPILTGQRNWWIFTRLWVWALIQWWHLAAWQWWLMMRQAVIIHRVHSATSQSGWHKILRRS